MAAVEGNPSLSHGVGCPRFELAQKPFGVGLILGVVHPAAASKDEVVQIPGEIPVQSAHAARIRRLHRPGPSVMLGNRIADRRRVFCPGTTGLPPTVDLDSRFTEQPQRL